MFKHIGKVSGLLFASLDQRDLTARRIAAVRADAEARGLKVFDATCPLVTKVHVEVGKMRKDGRQVIMIGHKGHPEVEGTMGQSEGGMHLVERVEDVPALPLAGMAELSFVTQTTLSVDDAATVIDALRSRFPGRSQER